VDVASLACISGVDVGGQLGDARNWRSASAFTHPVGIGPRNAAQVSTSGVALDQPAAFAGALQAFTPACMPT
jgi:hypothetical protein